MTRAAADLQVLVLPGPGVDLLLPAGAVAEMVRGGDLGPPPAGAPDWVLGTLAWRGHPLAVCRLVEGAGPGASPSALVVCFGPSGNPALPYLAIASPGLPHLERVNATNLASESDPTQGGPWFVRSPLRLNGRPAWLLDLEALEGSLLG